MAMKDSNFSHLQNWLSIIRCCLCHITPLQRKQLAFSRLSLTAQEYVCIAINSSYTLICKLFVFDWNTLNHMIVYKLFVLDRNTWNHMIVYKLFVLDRNTWNHMIVYKLVVFDRNSWNHMIWAQIIWIWLEYFKWW